MADDPVARIDAPRAFGALWVAEGVARLLTAMTLANPALLEIGGVFNERYEVKRCIKAGGMGAVYEVLHLQTKRSRALKVMLPSVVADEESRSRFKLEATVISAVESDHIAEVLDAGVDAATGSPFILMELLKGEELGAMVARLGRLPPEDVLLFLQHAAYALERTHEAGIVHRDLKPENLFVTYRDDGSPRVKLLDFGIAKVLGDTQTAHTRGILGTPLYISPEQVHGEQPISGRTDVYALAHIAYTLLAGEPYWKTEEEGTESIIPLLVMVMRGHSDKACARIKTRHDIELPPAFDAWFDKGAALMPDERHGGPLELVNAFAEVFDLVIASAPRALSRAALSNPERAAVSSPTPQVQTPAANASEQTAAPTATDSAALAISPGADQPQAVEAATLPSAEEAPSVMGGATASAVAQTVASPKSKGAPVPLMVVGALLLVGAGVLGAQLVGDAGDGPDTSADEDDDRSKSKKKRKRAKAEPADDSVGSKPFKYVVLIRGDLRPTETSKAQALHDVLVGATEDEARKLGNLGYHAMLGDGAMATPSTAFLGLDRWNSLDGMEEFYSDSTFEDAFAQLFVTAPTAEAFIRQTEWHTWGALDADVPELHYFVVARGKLAESDLDKAKTAHDQVSAAGQDDELTQGVKAHVVFTGLEHPREFLSIHVWHDKTAMAALYTDADFLTAYGGLFDSPPVFRAYVSTDWHHW